jgi:Flp pilus assembly protein CpaB
VSSTTRHLVLRVRLLALRHRRWSWLVVALLAIGAGGLVAGAQADADRARAAWSTTDRVLVARDRLDTGEVLTPDLVEAVAVPRALVPDGALTDVGPDASSPLVLAGPVGRGEILTSWRLRTDSVADRLDPDRAGVAVPTEGSGLPLAVGDRVDLVTWVDPLLGSSAPSGVISSGTVVEVLEASVVVAVPVADSAAVVAALGTGGVVPTLRP